ncbi:CRISPR-associated endonuclease Cas6 [Desulfobacula sp.]|uniref:CRISPR-associated endonuclease Cas6 n=1 Tax=Desulfobacula sp. TaxID=2593537 RepID=UPI002715105D|nr:CRISPR-associated endonuclease Cas6 [Desulfobacula sp.]
MKKAILYFNNIKLYPSQIHKLRGYVGNVFAEYDLIHNHDADTGKSIYRYPLIQFKIIDNIPCIVALTEKAVQIFTEIFMTLDQIEIEGRKIPINEKDLKIEIVDFGFSQETFMYEFITPWVGLNQKNFAIFINLKNQKEKNDLLKRILIGNILSMSKYLDLQLEQNQKINTDLQFQQTKVTLKSQQMIGFKGMFKTNFIVPDHMGLGKSVSRGFGSVKKIL